MPPDRDSARVQLLTIWAARAGYRLVYDLGSLYPWVLLDAADDEPLHSAATLDLIEQFLSE